MATRKKTQTNSTRSKKTGGRKSAKRLVNRQSTPKKSTKKAVKSKAAAKKKVLTKTTGGKTARRMNKVSRRTQPPGRSAISRKSSGLQSGDLQGLSDVESADSESVNELMEEGNAFEAGVVSGVEDSRGRNEQEVRTREVPEDDVPGEYQDEE